MENEEYEMHKLLDSLAKQYGTDKRDEIHGYTRIYSQLFARKRYQPKMILELGIFGGASLRMWRDYFPNAEIWGVDNNRECIFQENRIHCMLADACDPLLWQKLPMFDLIIDDAGHHPQDQVDTFILGFKRVNPMGYWVIEDTHTSFTRESIWDEGIYSVFPPLMIQQQMNGYGYGNFYTAREKNREHLSDISYEILGYQFYKSMIVLQKA